MLFVKFIHRKPDLESYSKSFESHARITKFWLYFYILENLQKKCLHGNYRETKVDNIFERFAGYINEINSPWRFEHYRELTYSYTSDESCDEMIPSPISKFPGSGENIQSMVTMPLMGMIFNKQLLNHQNNKERRYHCNVCFKSFDRSSSLSNHRLIHNQTKSYKCKHCNMKFLRKSDLAKHIITHTGSKPYQCSICGKRFSQSSNMLTHQRRHSGIRPYSCLYCGKSFFRKVDVKRHNAIHKN